MFRKRSGGQIAFWATLVVALAVVAAYFGPQVVAYWRVRKESVRSNDDPPRGWSSVPHPLTDLALSHAEGTILSYYGFRFEAPWKEVDRVRDTERTIEVRFKSGQSISLANPDYFYADPVSNDYAKADPEVFTRAFGPAIRESKYAQFREVVSTTPSQCWPFQSHRQFARCCVLLEIKGLWFEHNSAAPDILTFETETYRGFEISGLSRDWQNVSVNLFDDTNHWLLLNISGDDRTGIRINQAEVNRVIQTFAPVGAPQSSSPPS